MLDIGVGELLVIGVIAILFLGPDKLPKAIVDLAKLIKTVKKTLNEAKENLDREIHLGEIKSQAHEYKQMISSAGEELNKIKELPNLDEKPKVTPNSVEPIEPIIHLPEDKKSA